MALHLTGKKLHTLVTYVTKSISVLRVIGNIIFCLLID